MRSYSKTAILSCLLLPAVILSQAADTLKIHLTYKHKLNPTGQTTGYITVNQKFYTPDDIFFREINYDENTSQIADYTFYFYKNGKLYTGECYDQKDSLKYILKHEYDPKGNEVLLTKLVPLQGKLSPAGKTISRFDEGNRVTQVKEYTGKKLTRTARYSYNNAGRLIREVYKYKGAAVQKFKSESREYAYNPEGKIAGVTVTGRDVSSKSFRIREEYSYNEKNLLSGIKSFDSHAVFMGEKIYKYLASGSPSIYQENNANGQIILLIQYDYKKHYMDRGTQVSYYENL